MKSFIALFFLTASLSAAAQTYEVSSPNGDLKASVEVGEAISFSLALKGQSVISKASIAMDLGNGKVLGENPRLTKNSLSSESGSVTNVIANKERVSPYQYNVLSLVFRGDYELQFRAYDDGFTYRFVTSLGSKKEVNIFDEVLDINFPEGSSSFFPRERRLYSHYEQSFNYQLLDSIADGEFCALPVRFNVPGDVGVLITEADLFDYPNLFLQKKGEESFSSKYPPYPLEIKPNPRVPDRGEIMSKVADYIAKTTGSRSFPWRVFLISDDDRDFVASNLVMELSRPSQIKDTDWIKPGKIAWDWYNANNVYGVDFESGINTETYKYYIDFAAEYGLEYVILDEGWTKTTTVVKESNPDIDIPELVAYGKEKGVDLILWVLWHPLERDTEAILQLYSEWGVKGVKVDFMQRADQLMVNSLERIARIAAENKLMVDYHGTFKPAGLRSAYPNVMSYEGVLGNENNKWSESITPEHTVTLPFTRMVAGPMDFTPGAMINSHLRNYNISFYRPMSLGTRAHQVAMYVVYESPLQMLCDSPSRYLEDKPATAYISKIPSVWDETVVLHGKIADYIAVARRSDDTWYVGAMTDDTARDLAIDLSFLGEGSYTVEIMKDGINAVKYAEDYKIIKQTVTAKDQLNAEMVTGGGWTAIITKK